MHNIKWDDLQIVLAVVQNRSLSGAARTLGVNHATILRRIEGLERRIGIRLFERPPGGYRLRPEAQDLLSSLTAMSQSVDRIERTLTAARLGTGGSLRLTTTDSIAYVLLPRHLERLRVEQPDIEISVIVSNQPLDMTRPEAEITIRPTPVLPTGVEGREAARMAFGVFAAPAYLAANASGDPERHRWIGVEAPLTRAPVGAWQEAHLAVPPQVRADSFPIMARLAAEGGGLAALPLFVGRSEPGLVPVPGFTIDDVTRIWVAAHPDLVVVPRVADLIDFFTEAIGQDRALLE